MKLAGCVRGVLGALSIAAMPAVVHAAGEGYLGYLYAGRSVDLAWEETGTISRIGARLGEPVSAGQVLLVLAAPALMEDEATAQARLESARAEAERLSTELDQLQSQLARREKVAGAFAPEDLEAAKSQVQGTAAQLRGARARQAQEEVACRTLHRRIEQLTLRAPWDGIVASTRAQEGMRVRAGEPVLQLSASRGLRARFAVPAAEAAALRVGQNLSIRVGDVDGQWTATVDAVAPEVDPAIDMLFAEATVESGVASIARLAGRACRLRPNPRP
jgi:RND family efflux transporter MFP subunit